MLLQGLRQLCHSVLHACSLRAPCIAVHVARMLHAGDLHILCCFDSCSYHVPCMLHLFLACPLHVFLHAPSLHVHCMLLRCSLHAPFSPLRLAPRSSNVIPRIACLLALAAMRLPVASGSVVPYPFGFQMFFFGSPLVPRRFSFFMFLKMVFFSGSPHGRGQPPKRLA